MNCKSLLLIFMAAIMVCLPACSHHNSTPPAQISVSVSGSGSVVEGATSQYTATVSNDSSNSGVNWTCSTTGTASCSAANFSPAQTASGSATTFTAPSAVESVTITATSVADSSASFPLTVNITSSGTTGFQGAYSYYAAGTDADDVNYTVAGAITIDANGNVTGGEQDFNDSDGVTASADTITGGSLALDPTTNTGTLTLITNDETLGTETFEVSFPNNSHALIAEFDSDATSTGSLDLQTSPTTPPTGAYAFAGAGFDIDFDPFVAGGVMTVGSGSLSGTIDVDDDGIVTLDSSFSGSATAPDSFGRGTISNSPFGIEVSYYVVGPEVIRVIDLDTDAQLLGSAYGQGDSAGSFSNNSVGQSVISVSGNSVFVPIGLVGQFTTTPSGGSFMGVADVDDVGDVVNASAINGTYSMDTTGYGNMTITNAGALGYNLLGIYGVDLNLNINDPNNPVGGGGALVVELDTEGLGVGFLVPQTDIVTADFSGNYVFDGQFVTTNDEADFLANGSVSDLSLSGTGVVNDPFGDFSGDVALNSNVTFNGTFTADGSNPGRYVINPLNMIFSETNSVPITATVYQASGGELVWLETDSESTMIGQLQQQGSPSAGARRAARKAGVKH